MRFTFLGTGTSHGIPVIGCGCRVCTSRDSRDRRYRTSLLVENGPTVLLVDAPPELRLQLVRAGVQRVDALLLTHAHADHIAGLDDLRIFSERENRDFPVYGPAPALREIRRRYDYAFRNTQAGGGKPRFQLKTLARPARIQGIRIIPVPLWHGRIRVFGYRIGRLAYLTDVSRIPETSFALLKGLDTLVLDALRPEPHPTHFNLAQALAAARRIGARQTWLTHLCHRLGHRATERILPASVRLAYDGLQVTL